MWAFTTSIALFVPVLAIEPPREGDILRPIIPDTPPQRQSPASPMTDQPARIERDGALATIVIDHPPLNLFGEALVASIGEAIERWRARMPAR